MKIEYRGFWNYSGYAFAAMTNVVALKKAGHEVNVHTYDQPVYPLPSRSFTDKPDVVIDHVQPSVWRHHRVDGALNIGYTTWEADKIPSSWLKDIHVMDQVWVPCEWNKQVFIDCGVKIPTHVIPHHVKRPLVSRIEDEPRKFRFYTIATAHRRKNYMGLLYAFKEVLKHHDVELWVKITGERSDDYKNEFIKHGLWDNVKWMDQFVSQREMSEIHASCDCFVSLNTGEGFGLPIADAMAHGNEVIVTGFGAVLDYASDFARFVPYHLGSVDVSMEEHGFDRNMKDAKADWKVAAELMKETVVQGRRERPEAVEKLLNDHSIDTLGMLMGKAMSDREITMRFKDNGIGDMICFMYAFEGFCRLHSAMNVKIQWNSNKAEWMNTLSKLMRKIQSGPIGHQIEVSNAIDPSDFNRRSRSSVGYRHQYAELLYCDPVDPYVDRKRDNGIIMIFPGAAWSDRIWKKESFGLVAQALMNIGYDVQFHDDMADRVPDGFIVHQLSPLDITEKMKNCSLVIANDSGMAHLAGLLSVPCICISAYHSKNRIHDMNDVQVLYAGGLDQVSPSMVIQKALQMLTHR